MISWQYKYSWVTVILWMKKKTILSFSLDSEFDFLFESICSGKDSLLERISNWKDTLFSRMFQENDLLLNVNGIASRKCHNEFSRAYTEVLQSLCASWCAIFMCALCVRLVLSKMFCTVCNSSLCESGMCLPRISLIYSFLQFPSCGWAASIPASLLQLRNECFPA